MLTVSLLCSSSEPCMRLNSSTSLIACMQQQQQPASEGIADVRRLRATYVMLDDTAAQLWSSLHHTVPAAAAKPTAQQPLRR
jgi:hypothetical protein